MSVLEAELQRLGLLEQVRLLAERAGSSVEEALSALVKGSEEKEVTSKVTKRPPRFEDSFPFDGTLEEQLAFMREYCKGVGEHSIYEDKMLLEDFYANDFH